MQTRTILNIAIIIFSISVAGTSMAFESRKEGLKALSDELETLKTMIDYIESLPQSQGRFEIRFSDIKDDMSLIQRGLNDALKSNDQTNKLDRFDTKKISGDYIE